MESEGAPANYLILSLESSGAVLVPTEEISAFFDYFELARPGNPDKLSLSEAILYRDFGIVNIVGNSLEKDEK